MDKTEMVSDLSQDIEEGGTSWGFRLDLLMLSLMLFLLHFQSVFIDI